MKTLNTLSSLGTSINELYDDPKKQINIHLTDKPYIFHVILENIHGIDCKISSVNANLWFRTKNGMNREKYKSIKGLEKALVNLITKYVETEGDVSFSLSNEIYLF